MRDLLRKLLSPLVQGREVRAAADDWRRRRDELRAAFLGHARAAGTPHGLRWAGCEWTGPVLLARERETGLLTALAGVVVRFEAVEGGEMEDVEAVALPRDATAVFQYRGGWQTAGRALFNLTPAEAVARLGDRVEPVDPAEASLAP